MNAFVGAERGRTAGARGLSWFGIVRLALVQASLGAVVVLATSVLNRVMVVELGLAAMVPGALIASHHAVQILRPRWGHGADVGRRRTPWIVGGMAVLAAGGALAALGVAWAAAAPTAGLALAFVAFLMIGLGVGAAGTSLLTLLATEVAPERRAPAASIVWMTMIAGFVITAASVGAALEPFSMERLVLVAGIVSALAFAVSVAAVTGVEGSGLGARPDRPHAPTPFREALAEVWAEPTARRFTVFVFVSMLAYNAQDLILEPFGGLVFGMPPGETTQLSAMHHGGVLVGMLAFAAFGARRPGAIRLWTVGGCLASAFGFALLGLGALVGPGWPLAPCVFFLGFANGAFAVAAIGSMMGLASAEGEGRAGTRMGLWGAAQAIAFGLGGVAGAAAFDLARLALGSAPEAYAVVFGLEGALFVLSARLAAGVTPAGAATVAPIAPDVSALEFATPARRLGGARASQEVRP